ncbi:MAG: HAD-IIB family hydrolase, partial [Clostridia bacterium]|nr:HAD-IIB family hydrolase [Clostridia bacterium]
GFGGVVCSFNGGVISEVVSKKILFEKTFSNERSVNLLKTLEREGLFFLFFEREVYYANGRNAWLKTYEKLTSTKAEVVTGEAPSEFAKKRNMRLYKALVAVDEDKRNQLIARLSSILGDDYYITSGGSFLAEICVKGCTKGTAIKFLSAHYGIPVEEILAVGDGMNDLEMLQTAGLGIAVKNGDDSLKGKVRFYDYTNEEDAVRHIIEEFA